MKQYSCSKNKCSTVLGMTYLHNINTLSHKHQRYKYKDNPSARIRVGYDEEDVSWIKNRVRYLISVKAANHVQIRCIRDAAVDHEHSVVDDRSQRKPAVYTFDQFQ